MRVALYSAKSFEKPFLVQANEAHGHELAYFDVLLDERTVRLAEDFPVLSAFVSDRLTRPVLEHFHRHGGRMVALRSAGFNHVDLQAADELELTILRVPGYSPHAVAEHTVALMLALNRKLHRAFSRVREQNFALDGLMGFDLHGKTAGVVGTGKIGTCVARILSGFGCRVLAHDVHQSPECEALGVTYVDLETLAKDSDIITLHCPLTPKTHHMVGHDFLRLVRPGVMLVNTSRGALIDTRAVIDALKERTLGYLALDVYEEEGDFFFRDLSADIIRDDVLARLWTFPNVVMTAHQAFFTREAVARIAETTLQNVTDWAAGHPRADNFVRLDALVS